MKRIKYVGPDSKGVTAVPRSAPALFFPKGEPVEVPEDLAGDLLEQQTFQEVKKPKPVKGEGDK